MSASQNRADKQLIESINNNHQTLFVLSEEQLIRLHQDENTFTPVKASRTVAGYMSAALDFRILVKMVRDLGFIGRVYKKVVNRKTYIIFKGFPSQRTIFSGTRYLASNAKVMDMAIGNAGIKSSVRSGARLTVFLTVPVVILEHILKDVFLLSDLVADLASTMVKVGVSGIVAAITGIAVGTLTTVAAAPLAVAVFFGLAAGWTLDILDDRFGITEKLGQVLRDIEDSTFGKFERALLDIEQTLRWQIMNGISPGKGVFYP
jgi:hypothetical protein